MTSYDGGGGGRDPIDPDYAGLFRPEDLLPPAPEPPAPADDADDEPHFEPVLDPVIDPRVEEQRHEAELLADAAVPETAVEADVAAVAVEPAPALRTDPVADTGRIFRSQGVTGHDEAVLALPSDRSGRLRTLERRDELAPVLPDAGPVVVAGPAEPPAVGIEEAVVMEQAPGRRGHRSRRITGGAVYLIVIGVTVVVGFANAFLSSGKLGWPTGLALLVSSVYAALTVRREDDTVAIIVPPIAFFVAALTAGQLFLGSAEGSILNRAVVVFFTLADNWIWIIGATVAALAIVLVRRRRA